MSTYGYHRETTPFLDRFAEDSVVFERARSQAACTFPSVNSLLTSRYPFDFYSQKAGEMGIPPRFPALAEVLKGEGYRTIAISASPIVRNTESKENPGAGFGRGFDVFDEYCLWNNAQCVNTRLSGAMKTVEEPFFLYLHYMEPHAYYRPPANYERRFAGDYDGYEFIAEGDPNPIADMLFGDGPEYEISDRDIQHLIDLYDDEIRYLDQQLEALVTPWIDSGLLDRSLLVITSDHGEEFMEHNQVGHCRGVWDTLTRVPLIMRFPDVVGGLRVESAVQLVDVMPTILDRLGIQPSDFEADGISLIGAMSGDPGALTYAFSDQGQYRAVDDGHWQLIFDGVGGNATLFDLATDPSAQRDVFRSNRSEVDRLSEALNGWLTDTGQMINFDAALAAAKAKEDELRALGYLR
jgi:arylsulfatase A-like enzyme